MNTKYKKNPYGYKVCYRPLDKNKYIWRFLTHTFKQAKSLRAFYLKYPPPDDNGKPIINVIWKIKPITKFEYKNGIWNECPF